MTKIGRIWRDWKVWRTARKLEQELYPPRPEPKLNVFETFLHLHWSGRIALVVCAAVAYWLNVQATFSAHVFPHLQNVIGADGSFNIHELTLALYLSGVVLVLTLSPLLIWRAPWVTKPGLVVMAILLANASINNSSRTLKHGAELEIGTLKDKKTRMDLLTANKNAAKEAWQKLPPHEHVSGERLATAKAELESIKASAEAECNRSLVQRGVVGNARGPKCEGLETQRKTQSEKVDRLSRDKDLTDQEDDLRRAFTVADSQLQKEGAEVESTEAQVAPFPQFLANIHVVSQDIAVGWSKDQPTTDALTMEFQAWFGAPASVGFVFWIFGLFTCSKTEADKRLLEVTQAVTEKRAKGILASAGGEGITLSNVPRVEIDNTGPAEMDPDSPEAVLEIEGENLPAFAKHPETVAEAAAAAMLKADPHKTYERKARKRKAQSKDSVRQWYKELVIKRAGCASDSTRFRSSYEKWCEDMNVTPVNPTVFGIVLRDEFGIEKKGNGRIKYLNVDLRPGILRAVS